jgi:beta-galactosidase/beta-glucuronidase
VDARGEPTVPSTGRARVDGKFLAVDGNRFLVKGVAYGTFAPDEAGQQFPNPSDVAQDFADMARAGINTVRTYTPPPIAVLDEALRHGLRVVVGTAWPQHVPFLDDRKLTRRIRRDVVETVRTVASHPAKYSTENHTKFSGHSENFYFWVIFLLHG